MFNLARVLLDAIVLGDTGAFRLWFYLIKGIRMDKIVINDALVRGYVCVALDGAIEKARRQWQKEVAGSEVEVLRRKEITLLQQIRDSVVNGSKT